MINKNFLKATVAAAILSSGIAYAEDNHADMEKCMVAKDGHGMIKEGKGDCGSKTNSCAGSNKAGDAEAWILVPKGECEKINKGDLSGVSEEVKAKLDMGADSHH